MEGGQLSVVRTSAVCRAPASCAARLTYSPPTHYSTGVPGHITDPFEDNTVRVRAHSLSECDFEILKRHQAPAHIWGLPR